MEEQQKLNKVFVGRSGFRKVHNPEPTEKQVNGVIRWGLDNLHPNELINMAQDNPIHGGILNQKITYMTSAGVVITGPADIVEMLERAVPDAVSCYEYFNGYALQVTILAEGKFKIEHLDFDSVRFLSEENWFGVSDDWSCTNQTAEKTNYKKLLDIDKAPLAPDQKSFILYYRVKPKQRKIKKKLSLSYYPVPSYSGGIVSILAGIEHDYFTYSEAVNGYKGGTLVSMNNGQPATPEKADEIADKIKGEATDRDTQGGIVVVFADGADNATTVASLNGNDLDKRYIEANKEIRTKIMTAHSVGSPTLFGISNEAAFGSKEEMETAYTLFANNYVLQRQKAISESIESKLKKVGIEVTIKFNKYVLSLTQEASEDNKVLRQLNSMSPLVASKVLDSMSPDEIRALAKLIPKQTVMTAEKLSVVTNKILLRRLSETGVKRSEIKKIHKSRTFDYQSTDEEFLSELQDEAFDGLTPLQTKILKLIADGKTFNEVSKIVGKGALGLSIEIIKLQVAGHLKGWKISDTSPSVKVLYSYEVKPGLGAPIIPTSREFCRDLVTLDRLYTREDIDALSSELDMDVWRYRGGWYHNPKTDKTTPSCRHEWRQNIVSK